jgi:hypothetical protein
MHQHLRVFAALADFKPSDELKPARHVMVDQGGGTDRIDRLAPITEIPSFAEVLWY